MTDIFLAIFLGLVQGFTEFIPVSSSGHLVLLRPLLGIEGTPLDLSFDAVLQLATAFALLVYFWRDITGMLIRLLKRTADTTDRILASAIIVGTIPSVIAGLLLEEYMDTVFRSTTIVAWMLLFGSALMVFAEYIGTRNKILSITKGLWVGMFQCLALIPGVSRSGATISGGLLFGLSRTDAARFSFFLSIPIVLGSGLKKLFDLYSGGALSVFGVELVIGAIAAFLSGLVAVHVLLSFLKNHTLYAFVYYRVALAICILLFV